MCHTAAVDCLVGQLESGVSPNMCRLAAIKDAAAGFDVIVDLEHQSEKCFPVAESMINKCTEIFGALARMASVHLLVVG